MGTNVKAILSRSSPYPLLMLSGKTRKKRRERKKILKIYPHMSLFSNLEVDIPRGKMVVWWRSQYIPHNLGKYMCWWGCGMVNESEVAVNTRGWGEFKVVVSLCVFAYLPRCRGWAMVAVFLQSNYISTMYICSYCLLALWVYQSSNWMHSTYIGWMRPQQFLYTCISCMNRYVVGFMPKSRG